MEDRLLKFAKVVELRSFTKAAKALHISQPALTTSVKKLERELKSELLVRGTHNLTVTPAGNIAYAAAKDLNIQLENLKLRLYEDSQEKVTLNLGLIDSIADLLFVHGDHLGQLKERLHISLTVNNSSELTGQIMHDQLDAALIAAPLHVPRALEVIPIASEPLVLVAHVDDRKQTEQELRDGSLRHFLSYNNNSQTHRLIEQSFLRQGIAIEPVFYSTSPEIMLQLVLAGQGIAVLPYLLVKEYLAESRLQRITIGKQSLIARDIVLLHRKGRDIPEALKQLLQKTKQELTLLTEEASA